jgi:hypothetical protein
VIGEREAPIALREPLVVPGLGGFKIFGVDYLVEELGGLSTFGDLPPARMFFACGAEGIS